MRPAVGAPPSAKRRGGRGEVGAPPAARRRGGEPGERAEPAKSGRMATVVGMSRQITSATVRGAVAFTVITVLAGCVPGLAADPRSATNPGAQPQGVPPPKPPPSGPPPIAAPKNDLSWHDCTSRVFTGAAVSPAPDVQLDCATYDADLD